MNKIICLIILFSTLPTQAQISQEILGLSFNACNAKDCVTITADKAVVSKFRSIYALSNVRVIGKTNNGKTKIEHSKNAILDWHTREVILDADRILNFQSVSLINRYGEAL